MGPIEWLLLIALSILWGCTFLLAEVALEEVRPFTLVLGRVSFAAMFLLVMVYATGHRMPRGWRAWAPFLVMGGLNNVLPFNLIFWGQIEITGGLASVHRAARPFPHPRRTDHARPPGRRGAGDRRGRRHGRA
jgi:drug/metabolite transporter (DMT)-like permease